MTAKSRTSKIINRIVMIINLNSATKKKFKEKPRTSILWQGKKASNPRPTVLETAALPAELFPFILVGLQGLEPQTDRL